MKIRVFPLASSLVCLLLGASMATAQPKTETVQPDTDDVPSAAVWLTDIEAAVDLAKKDNRYILVDLYAEWCGWCHELEEKVFTHPNFHAYVEDQRFVLLRVDTEDRGEGTWLKARYGASSLPTTLILDSNLIKVGAVAGFAPMPTFVEYLQEQIDGYDTILSFYDKVLTSDDAELQRKLASDLHQRGDGNRAAKLYEQVLARIQQGTDAEAWLTYQTADAYRMSRAFDDAYRQLDKVGAMAKTLNDAELQERVAFLDVQMAQEAGDCQKAESTLEHFLSAYPESFYAKDAKRTLDALRKGEALECT